MGGPWLQAKVQRALSCGWVAWRAVRQLGDWKPFFFLLCFFFVLPLLLVLLALHLSLTYRVSANKLCAMVPPPPTPQAL